MKDMTMRKAIIGTLVGLIIAVATAAPAQAQGPIPVPATAAAPPPPPPVTPEPVVVPVEASPPAPSRRRLHVGAAFLPMSLGKFSAVYGGMPITADAALAPGLTVFAGYDVIPGLSVGLSPQYLFNVGTKEDPTGGGNAVTASREIDVMARVAYAYPIAEGIGIFAEVLPGYSLILPENGDPAKGFVLAFGAGANLELTDRAFVTLGGGYQIGFQTRTDDVGVKTDVRTRYIRIALGMGWRF
jgi:hypothetical protein